jgi:hypothetical protein
MNEKFSDTECLIDEIEKCWVCEKKILMNEPHIELIRNIEKHEGNEFTVLDSDPILIVCSEECWGKLREKLDFCAFLEEGEKDESSK